MPRGALPLLTLAVLPRLAGCGQAPVPEPPGGRDPEVAAALADPLMTDPDLVEQNHASLLLDFAGFDSAPIPAIERGDDAVAAARAEAAALLGTSSAHAPDPVVAGAAAPRTTAHLAAVAALTELGLPRTCADRAGYAMIWAARLPAAVPIYPRGHAQEAAGIDSPECHLRAVHFLSPVPPGEIVDFYWSRGRAAGFAAGHRRAGADHVAYGRRGTAGFVAFVREQDGLSAVDLVTTE